MPPKGKIPDRWIPYKQCGDVIEGTRIICFKVPLHKKVQLRVPEITKIWDIPAVLKEIPKLGAVIDLTNTARYYDPSDFEEANVRHLKILMPGRVIPPERKVREFMDAVDEFLGKDCDSLVGVHCTHGLNRTGYMVCRYMRDRLNIPAEDAIKRFEKARGYEIERQIYRAGLLGLQLPRPDIEWNGCRSRDFNQSFYSNNPQTNIWNNVRDSRNSDGSRKRNRQNSHTSKNDDDSVQINTDKKRTRNKKRRHRNKMKKRKQKSMENSMAALHKSRLNKDTTESQGPPKKKRKITE